MCPMLRSKYPPEWDAISKRIRFERANNKCEQCGVENGALIIRSTVDGARYIVVDTEAGGFRWPDGTMIRLSEIPDEYPCEAKWTRVILTVHHIGIDKENGEPGSARDKMDCRDENLICLCQRDHLKADMAHHVAMARITRLQKRDKAIAEQGQMSLFE